MSPTRDHDPLVIEDFAGWWSRGDPESCPSNHFTQADNVQYFYSGVQNRDGLTNYLAAAIPQLSPIRIYNYVTQNGQSLLVLSAGGQIFHITGPTSQSLVPILTIPAMEDFGFVAINGRAYITPFKTYTNAAGEKYQLGLKNDYVYVYNGDGTPARTAAGHPPVGSPLVVSSSGAGLTDTGFHIIAVVYETDSGYLTALGPQVFGKYDFPGTQIINVSNIPVSPDTFVKKRHLVSTKFITGYNSDQAGYQFFFIPNGVIGDNTTTTWSGTYFDSDLISDASHLIDNFSLIPSGVNLNTYHSRLVIVGEFGTDETLLNLPTGVTDNRSLARVSTPGEPEAISKVDGLIVVPLDGKALTNVQEYRDILYLFKNTRTFAYSDNNDVPSSWIERVVDQGVGASVHGVATVLDTGGVNIDFLLIADWSGFMFFNGTYAQPELSWKIENFWRTLDRNQFDKLQVVNDSINKKIWITLPSPNLQALLHADYKTGMDSGNIKWAQWLFDVQINTIALIETDRLVIGSSGPVS